MHLGNDFRYAFRQLRRSPGFAVTAVLTLALGIGATTAIFSLMYAALFKPLEVQQPQQLFKVGQKITCCVKRGVQEDWNLFSWDIYESLRDQTPALHGQLAAFDSNVTSLLMRRAGEGSAAVPIFGKLVSGNYFSVLGVPLAEGRGLTPADDQPGAPPAAVISQRMWDRRFGRDAHVVGSTLLLNGTAVNVVGVAGPGFFGETVTDDIPELWLPIRQQSNILRDAPPLHQPNRYWLDMIARVPPGTNPQQLESQLSTGLRQWLQAHASTLLEDDRQAISRQHTSLASAAAGVNIVALYYKKPLEMLMGAAGFLMLIVCANVANLLLVRALAQTQQTSVRMALGASREQLLQQALISSLVLALLGCIGAVGIAYLLANSFVSVAFPIVTSRPINTSISVPMLAFAMGLAAVTSVVFGVGPAWVSTRNNLASVLRAASRTTRSSGTGPQRALVIAQAALSVVLLCSAGLLMRSLNNLRNQDLGFRTQDRYVITIDPQLAGYGPAQTDALNRKIEERMLAIPGAQRVGLAIYAPMSGDYRAATVYFPGQADPQPNNAWAEPEWNRVSPEWFNAIGTRLREGRFFTDADDKNQRHVAIVNEAFVKRYLQRDAIGQHFGLEPGLRDQFEIIGVAHDTKYGFPDQPTRPMFFLPFRQTFQTVRDDETLWESGTHYANNVVLELHGSDQPRAEAAMRQAMRDVDANLPVSAFYTFENLASYGFIQSKLLSRLSALFAGVALLLAAIGIYGVTAYSVERRTGEIGIRMALGASRLRILREVVQQSLVFCLIGLVVGVPLSYVAGRLLAARLFGVGSFDFVSVTIAVVLMTLSAALAALLPARRAASIEPMRALRTE